MKADTFAKLTVLQTLVDADVGYLLEHHPSSSDRFREGMISRVSDLVDEVDALDAVAAARTYDALVDFLAELPDDDAGIVDATLNFRRSMTRTIERGMDTGELKQGSTWAVVLDELLEELVEEYRRAVGADGKTLPREYMRSVGLLSRAREAAERLADEVGGSSGAEIRAEMDRLTFAIRHQRLQPEDVEPLIRAPQRHAERHRPSPLSRIGAFVLGQVLKRDRRRRQGEGPGGVERRKRPAGSAAGRAGRS